MKAKVNAKEELLKVAKFKRIECANLVIDAGRKNERRLYLAKNYSEEEFDAFLKALDFTHNDIYDSDIIIGTIWFTDGSWADREPDENWMFYWHVKKRPQVPDYLLG